VAIKIQATVFWVVKPCSDVVEDHTAASIFLLNMEAA
jgi:hypothetical protein